MYFFLNFKGTFGNQEGMFTWCWLAKHACIKLVSLFKWIWKGISETHCLWVDLLVNAVTVISSSCEKKSICSKAQSFGGKAKGCFHPKIYWFAAWKNLESGQLVLYKAKSYRTFMAANWELISSFCFGSPYYYHR